MAAVIIALATILGAMLFLVTKKQGRSIWESISRLAQRQKVASKKHVYLSGPTGFTPDGQVRLPGLMAKSQLTESSDSYGNPFGPTPASPPVATTTTPWCSNASPNGDNLIDQADVDNQVAHWANWLTQLAAWTRESAALRVTIESSQDSGLRLQKLLADNHREDAPEFAQRVVERIAQTDHFRRS